MYLCLPLCLIFLVILAWFVDNKVASDAVNCDVIIQEEDIEVRPEKVSASCLDQNVCLDSCRKYCSKDAWIAIQNVVDVLRKDAVYYCGRCTCPIDDEMQPSLLCDCCLTWYHFKCLNLKNSPKAKTWICRTCYDL